MSEHRGACFGRFGLNWWYVDLVWYEPDGRNCIGNGAPRFECHGRNNHVLREPDAGRL